MPKPFIRDASLDDITIIQELAEKTWWPTYSSLLSSEQIRYMLDTIYSTETLRQAISDHSQYFIILSDECGDQGFAAFGRRKEDAQVFKLHKLYVLPENHGKGYGKLLVTEVSERILKQGSTILDLNVKRDNPAKNFYEKLGFKILREEDIPLGPYWLEDYVMRLELGSLVIGH